MIQPCVSRVKLPHHVVYYLLAENMIDGCNASIFVEGKIGIKVANKTATIDTIGSLRAIQDTRFEWFNKRNVDTKKR